MTDEAEKWKGRYMALFMAALPEEAINQELLTFQPDAAHELAVDAVLANARDSNAIRNAERDRAARLVNQRRDRTFDWVRNESDRKHVELELNRLENAIRSGVDPDAD